MVVAVRQPCRVRYRRRGAAAATQASAASAQVAESPPSWRVRVDLDLCQGHGVCAAEAPEVFAIDEEELRVRVLEERPGAWQRKAVLSAVRHCPTRALRIEEE
jgi:ferredoxin